MHYLLFYEYAPDYIQRRAEFRNEHLTLAWQAHERGELLLGGAYAEPADGALLLFQDESPAVVEKFVAAALRTPKFDLSASPVFVVLLPWVSRSVPIPWLRSQDSDSR